MKKILNLLSLVLLAALLLGLTSCDMLAGITGDTQTKDQVLSAFFRDVASENWGNMYTHIHPDNSLSSQLASGTAFSTAYGSDDYGSHLVTSQSSNTYSVSVTYGTTGSYTETFSFKEDGEDNWLILSFTVNGTNYR